MFPIHIKHMGTEVPKDDGQPCYILARNGFMLRKTLPWAKVTVPVKQMAILDEEPASCELTVPTLDPHCLVDAIQFFRRVCKEHNAEALGLLYYSEDDGWMIDVPKHTVSGLQITEYDQNHRYNDMAPIGTIHSHANAPAGHSNVDHHDEVDFDGIHITIGHCGHPSEVSISVEIVVNGVRFSYDLDDCAALQYLPPKFKPFEQTRMPWMTDVQWERIDARNKQRKKIKDRRYVVDTAYATDRDLDAWMQQVTVRPAAPTWGAQHHNGVQPGVAHPVQAPAGVTRRSIWNFSFMENLGQALGTDPFSRRDDVPVPPEPPVPESAGDVDGVQK